MARRRLKLAQYFGERREEFINTIGLAQIVITTADDYS